MQCDVGGINLEVCPGSSLTKGDLRAGYLRANHGTGRHTVGWLRTIAIVTDLLDERATRVYLQNENLQATMHHFTSTFRALGCRIVYRPFARGLGARRQLFVTRLFPNRTWPLRSASDDILKAQVS
ncbi:hypothetical protein CC1G_05265 [Coprinopsis cinerea okayama7|uniref:Uncharacterized protein n=1 Tax=Coprinopsis cinerea (strain Okayama-7 / 130 / ATCC MYA-4618 / FGSC 9003) TaxID=240176 RepID=A8PCE8_COPC7|nr:hypothetical protein CC1G_05265 [Coprinopsis cinerea okayama7\|eukprot:XP_001840379.2 hypothetical protein CC1G_05265 [Coprinopsis cinerea okayama7\